MPAIPHQSSDHAHLLDLDAVVVSHLDELTAWIATRVSVQPERILDLGAGSGTGALALARRFPDAAVVALDNSRTMLEHIAGRLRDTAGGNRISPVLGDADLDWPEMGSFDLVWASSSLHHVKAPAHVLSSACSVLNTDGTLAVVEMDGLPFFLPDGASDLDPRFEERLRSVAAAAGWNRHPDWTSHIEHAGFSTVDVRTFTYRRSPAPDDARTYAHRVYVNIRSRLAAQLDPDDLANLDKLLDESSSSFVLRRDDLEVRSARTVWSARRA